MSKSYIPGKYKIDPESETQKVLDEILNEYAELEGADENGNAIWKWNNENAEKEYNNLKELLTAVDDENSRKYIISKRLGKVPEFSHSSIPSLDEYRDLKWQEDFKAPTWDNIEKLEPGFFDPNSPNYFRKMNKEELGRYQKKMGIEDAKGFEERAGQEELKRTRYKIAHGEDLGGWFDSPTSFAHNLGGATMSLLAPRSQEAIERGEDPTIGDIALDAIENAAYTYNPGSKIISPALALKNDGAKLATWLLGNGFNPALMEGLDASVYNLEDRDTDRKDFSVSDVGIGTLVNAGMAGFGKRVPGSKKIFEEPKNEIVTVAGKQFEVTPSVAKKLDEAGIGQINTKYNAYAKGKPKISRTTMDIKGETKGLDKEGLEALREQEWKKFKKEYPDAAKNLEMQDKFWEDVYKKGTKKQQKRAEELLGKTNTYMNQLNLGGYKEAPLGVGSFVSNKTGDLLSENPAARNYVIRQGLRGTGVPGRLVYPLLDYSTDLSEKEKLEELLGR